MLIRGISVLPSQAEKYSHELQNCLLNLDECDFFSLL